MRTGDIIQVVLKTHSGPGMKNEAFRPCCRWPSNRPIRRRGVVLIWTAILIMVMILFVGLSLDTGKLVYNVQQLQNAADAAALAGAIYVKTELPEFTRQKTRDMGLENAAEGIPVMLRWDPSQPQPATFPTTTGGSYDYTNYDIVVGRWVTYNQTFVPTLDSPNAVMVIARRNAALAEMGAPPFRFIWGPIVGVNSADGVKQTVAFCNSSNGAGFIVLSPEPTQGLEIGANAIVDIDNGGIHVNSTAIGHNNNDGAWIHGTPVIDAGYLNVVGGVTPPPDDDAWESIFAEALAAGETGGYPVMNYEDGIQHIKDPLAAEMLGPPQDPYVEAYYANEPEYGPGARLLLPELLDSEGGIIPTRCARWNDSSSGYDLISPADPSVYMRWNNSTSSYDLVPADPIFDHPSLFRDTVGMVSEIVTDPNTGEPVLDPITGLPTYSTGNGNVIVTLPPGYYPYGMRLTTGDDVTLAPSTQSGPGTFFIWGGGSGGTDVGLYMSAGSLIGNGVTCCVTQNFATGVPGVLRITGGHLDVDSPGDYANQNVDGLNGIAIWQDPAMTPLPEAHLNGNGDFSIEGTIYCPDPIHLRLEGDLGDTGNQILCGTASILGTAEITVNYDGRNEGNNPSQICIVQ